MVAKSTNSVSYQSKNKIDFQENEFNWSSVPLSEVIQKKNRLEASNFEIKVRAARQLIKDCKWPVVNLWSDNGLAKNAQYPGRFKRIYVDKKDGYPFYLPTQITDLYPKPTKWISPITHSGINILKAHDGELLINRSGTIGPVTIVSRTLKDKIMSDDIIRVIPKDPIDLGYLYAFLKTNTGQVLLTTNSYGAVISHIEPDHLQNLPIPNPSEKLKGKIHELIINSFEDRDLANDLIDKAEKLLIAELKLPPIQDLKPNLFNESTELNNYQIKLSYVDNRLDASYHVPIVNAIINKVSKSAKEITTISDIQISQKIVLPGRFKRIYVEEGEGTVFIGGKQINELDPSNKKYLSSTRHGIRIKQDLKLYESIILITRSGTIGKVNIVPKHWSNWVINEHVIRVFPKDEAIAGYLFAWLSTEYGTKLIERFTYGAVVDEIDTTQVGAIKIPILKNHEIQNEINNNILMANKLRYEAYLNEQQAIKMVNEFVIHATKEKLRIAAEPKVKFGRNKK